MGSAIPHPPEGGCPLAQSVEQGIPADHPDILRLTATKEDHESRYLADAAEVRLSRQQMSAKVILTDELSKISFGDAMPPWVGAWMTLIWRQLSGATHGDMGAIATLSKTQYRLKIPGGWIAQVSVDDTSFVGACDASALLQTMAMQLYTARSTLLRA